MSGAGCMRLELLHIKKSFTGPGSTGKQVLKDIRLTVSSGDCIGITGPSGTGKTTLGLILTGLLRPDRGQVRVNHSDFWSASGKERRAMGSRLQMVFQHPESSFDPRWTMQQSLAEPFRLNGIRPDISVLKTCLERVGLDASMLFRHPHQLSGGELQRIAIARIMVLEPRVVVLDEPTAMLDVITQARIMSLLDQFHRENTTAYVLISHDLNLIQGFCNRIYRLENGQLLDEAPIWREPTRPGRSLGLPGL